MKTLSALLLGASGFVLVFSRPIYARQPYKDEFDASYVKGNKNEAFVTAAAAAKCNICHDPQSKSKQDHNEYGKGLKKHLTKADFMKLKDNKPALTKKIQDALKAAETEKNAAGKTFGEIIKGGKLPGG